MKINEKIPERGDDHFETKGLLKRISKLLTGDLFKRARRTTATQKVQNEDFKCVERLVEPTPEEIAKLESEINRILKETKETMKTGNSTEQNDAVMKFLDSLKNLPTHLKSVILSIRLDTRDERINRYLESLAKIGSRPLDSDPMLYELPILIPRNVPMGNITAPHGSLVRERVWAVGRIATIDRDFWYDPETEQTETPVFIINPTGLGVSLVDRSFGKYWLFPRQIENVKLSTEMPAYLGPQHVAFVDQFYNAM